MIAEDIPLNVFKELFKLDEEIKGGLLTKQCLYNKKWSIIEPYVSNDEKLKIQNISTEKDEYFELMDKIVEKVMFISVQNDFLDRVIEKTPSPEPCSPAYSPIPVSKSIARRFGLSTFLKLEPTRRSARLSCISDQNLIQINDKTDNIEINKIETPNIEKNLNTQKNDESSKIDESPKVSKNNESKQTIKTLKKSLEEKHNIETPKVDKNQNTQKNDESTKIDESPKVSKNNESKQTIKSLKKSLEDDNKENIEKTIKSSRRLRSSKNDEVQITECENNLKDKLKNSTKPETAETGTQTKHVCDVIDAKIKSESDDEFEESVSKKIKLNNAKKEIKKIKIENKANCVYIRCDICHQIVDDELKLYGGHPNNAVDEFVALTDPKLSLFTGEEDDVHESDIRPQNKITHFSIYDKAGHLCPFDSGLIEQNAFLYISGYLKPVYDEDEKIENGIPTKDLGPINEWWISGFDGGEKVLVGISTEYGEYLLMEPSPEYAPMMESVKLKTYLGKITIEFLLDEENPSFEDLLNKLQTSVPPPGIPKITEDSLIRHAQFICDQVFSFEDASDINDQSLITTPCMRSLVHLAGVTYRKQQAMLNDDKKQFKSKKPVWSKATTTPLVNYVFEKFFSEQLDNTDTDIVISKGANRKRCGVCEACMDCGTCIHCKGKTKFGGDGTSKKACITRRNTSKRCPNMAVQDADDSDPDDEDTYQQAADEIYKSEIRVRSVRTSGGKKEVNWSGNPLTDDGRRVFYRTAIVNKEMIKIGDCVSVEPVDPSAPLVIGKVMYMWENKLKQKFMHAHWFLRSSETVLGETGDPQELFLIDECENSLLSGIYCKVSVVKKTIENNWADQGGKEASKNPVDPQNDKSFFYQKFYNEIYGRFEDPYKELVCNNPAISHRFCPSCERLYQQQKFENPTVGDEIKSSENSKEAHYELVKWRGEEYTIGSCVFLYPNAFKFKTHGNVFKSFQRKGNQDDIDENLYPEFYRKSSDIQGSNVTTPNPFCIGLITDILTTSKQKLVSPIDICLRVIKFYRPENTIRINKLNQDMNKLYASTEEVLINFGDVTGKCYVVFSENLNEDVFTWSKQGPHRFYFNEAYDSETQKLIEPPKNVKNLGNLGKGKGKSRVKNDKKKVELKRWPEINKPLKCLDVFAGCGGLSEGLHQSNVAETLWAIEKDESAANAFRINNPDATVFSEDCNLLLKLIMNGKTITEKGQKLPLKGEVELLCGGPPCQGFSGMNRFNSSQYSIFKNSLVVSYLSYCDYYRPRFFILENVRNFFSFKRSMVFKLTVCCLLKMGYQVTFGILQAGNYGIPQTRRRAIIMAAAPGEVLPNFPEPQHVFNPRATQLSVMVDDKKFISNCLWTDSAPYRTVTVRDAMSDLPHIPNGFNNEEIPYIGDPITHFQKLMRNENQSILKDHICKDMVPIVEARISHIPIAGGSDWRDLPNISVRLKDNTYTKKLLYLHDDKKNGKSGTGALRGVCACASKNVCDPMDRQFNTLIPWCLPHTGNRHNNWAGLYGRLEWDGFFSTTVTNPEPMGKQGRVLHPEQTRVVSVRECARSQGFPDRYRFYGSILDKHRQVGNAVPPPLGAAIGHEIAKCVSINVNNTKENMEVD